MPSSETRSVSDGLRKTLRVFRTASDREHAGAFWVFVEQIPVTTTAETAALETSKDEHPPSEHYLKRRWARYTRIPPASTSSGDATGGIEYSASTTGASRPAGSGRATVSPFVVNVSGIDATRPA